MKIGLARHLALPNGRGKKSGRRVEVTPWLRASNSPLSNEGNVKRCGAEPFDKTKKKNDLKIIFVLGWAIAPRSHFRLPRLQWQNSRSGF